MSSGGEHLGGRPRGSAVAQGAQTLRRSGPRGGQTDPHSGNRTGAPPCQSTPLVSALKCDSYKGNPTEMNPKTQENFRTGGQRQRVP